MPKKQNAEGLQPDGRLIFSIILTPDLAKQFLDAMATDERESKSEFGRILIKRQLQEVKERREFEEFKRLRLGASEIPHVPGDPQPTEVRKLA